MSFKKDIFCEINEINAIKYKIVGICLELDEFNSYGEAFLQEVARPEYHVNVNLKFINEIIYELF